MFRSKPPTTHARRACAVAAFLAVAGVLLPSRLHKALLEVTPPICHVATRQKVVALTYDDGPQPVYTPELLRILRRYRVKATFFMIGARMARWPEIVKEAARDGHVIANHTYSHPNNLASMRTYRIVHEINAEQRLIVRLVGRAYPIFRPPKGLVGRHLDHIAHAEGYSVVLWSVSAYHHEARTPELMMRRVIDQAHPGAIILMHDGRYQMRWRDVRATPLIIEALSKRGYRFVTIPQLLEIGGSM